VLVYEGQATSAAVAGADSAIDFVADADGRSWERQRAIEGLVTHQLGGTEVFLIYAQQSAGDSVLGKLGEEWGNALAGFLRTGGVIVMFEAAGQNRGTFQILEPAQIFSAAALGAAAGDTFTVADPGDQIALGVPKRYIGRGQTVTFESVATPANAVVEDSASAPDPSPGYLSVRRLPAGADRSHVR
jgi:hypothetical protein